MKKQTRIAVLTALLASASAPLAAAQLSRQPGRSTGTTTAMVTLSDQPVALESGRVRFYPPAGSTWQRFRGLGNGSTQVTAEDQSWFINVQTPASTNLDQTAADVADAISQQLLQSQSGPRLTPTLLSRERNLIVNGLTAERFYVRQPQPGKGNRPGTPIIRGYTVLPLEPGLFATFELVTTEPSFADSRATFETVVATVEVVDPDDDQASLASATDAAKSFLTDLTSEDYLRAINANTNAWHRLAEPASTGRITDDRELSYRRVNARVGNRGELAQSAGGNQLASPQNERGYLVGIDSRYLTPEQIVDSRGTFFMTSDRRREAWVLTLTIRDRANPKSTPLIWTERGVRENDQLRVRVTQSDGSVAAFDPTVDPDITLTQVERFLLGDLLVAAGASGDHAFQHWSSNTTSVTQRRDTITRLPESITVSSTMGADTRAQITRYNPDGSFRSTALPTGAHQQPAVWTPVQPQRLAGIWRDKGLPID
ncbi:MAG: hypothetical protein AAGB51_01600 [Planctomycetota bacterium]